jgi:hypothetical protein
MKEGDCVDQLSSDVSFLQHYLLHLMIEHELRLQIDQHIQFRIEIYCQGLNMVCHYGIESTHVLESLHQLF